MSSVANLLSKGNGKLGENIHHWSIPAVDTCPGRSNICETHCYARSGRYRTDIIRDRLNENLQASKAKGFISRMAKEVQRRWVQVCRIHVAGDFYDVGYARKWVSIARRCPRTIFYSYTRSWRIDTIEPVLREMATLDNVRLWYSADSETGIPPMTEGVRIAWLQDQGDGAMETVDLVFRVRRLRREPARRIGLSLVCPVENGSDRKTDCGTCRHCWN